MTDLIKLNLEAIIAFGIMMIVAILAYAVFFKEDVDRRLRSSSKHTRSS